MFSRPELGNTAFPPHGSHYSGLITPPSFFPQTHSSESCLVMKTQAPVGPPQHWLFLCGDLLAQSGHRPLFFHPGGTYVLSVRDRVWKAMKAIRTFGRTTKGSWPQPHRRAPPAHASPLPPRPFHSDKEQL